MNLTSIRFAFRVLCFAFSVSRSAFCGSPLWRRLPGVLLAVSCGCTGLKYVPEGSHLYTGAKIKFDAAGNMPDKARLTTEMEAVLRPKPNKKILGSRPGVWFYYIAGTPKKKKGLRGLIKNKLGRAPVYFEKTIPERTAKNLQTVLRDNGYFEGQIIPEVEKGEKTASVTYTAKVVGPPYHIREIRYEALDSVYGPLSSGLRRKSLLRTGRQYRVSQLEKELERIGEAVRDSGYYYFDDDYLIFNADSSAGGRQVDLHLGFENKVPRAAKTIYRLDTVEIVNHYTLSRDSTLHRYDTVRVEGYQYLSRRNDFRPGVILNSVNLKKDSLYRRINHEYTLNRLTNLGVFKFVNVRFTPRGDSLLKAQVFLTPLLKKSLRLEVQMASKSNNFVGPSLTASYINRNFLKGAELFQFQVNSSYEVQVNAQQPEPINAFELGSEASLTLPRFLTPFNIRYTSFRFMPQTTMRLGFLFQNRVGFFKLNSFNAAYGYLWRETEQKTHAFYPADVIYFRRGRIFPEFQERLARDPFLERSTQNQFILGSRYSYTYNSQTGEQEERRRDNIYFSGNVDVSGNMASLLQRMLDRPGGGFDEPYTIAGQPYSQYARGDVDVRYYHDINRKHQLAARVIAGVGYAYGNAFTMPYVKQFTAGGSNSVRAFRARSLGPGGYQGGVDRDIRAFIDQAADMKLESSVEYRFGIAGFLKGAAFVDAGNIWLLRSDSTRPNADFEWNRFGREIAVGTGLGVRLDASFFVLRLDAAFPLRRPDVPEAERWVVQDINFLNRDWRRNNLILNIAIGYPF